MSRRLAVILATAASSGCALVSVPTASLPQQSCHVWYLQNAHDTTTPMYAHVLVDHSDIVGSGSTVPGATMRSDGGVFMTGERLGQYDPSGALVFGTARVFVPDNPQRVAVDINGMEVWFGHGAKCTRAETALGISGLLFYLMQPSRKNGNLNTY